MKIIAIAEDISFPIDEGFKKFSYQFFKHINNSKHKSLLFSRTSNPVIDNLHSLPNNKLFFSISFYKLIRKFNPDYVYYVPSSSYSFMSFVRLGLIILFVGQLKSIIVGLQHREYNSIEKVIIKNMIRLNLVVTFSSSDKKQFDKLGLDSKIIPAGVNVDKFKPANSIDKVNLRKKYSININKKVILHIGHINEYRNVGLLKVIAANGYTAILVGSSSTKTDEKVKKDLISSGVLVFDGYIEAIEEFYQLSDVYLFPVTNTKSVISFPLSVLEAMACNLPVLSTKYDALIDTFKESEGFKYFASEAEMLKKLKSFFETKENYVSNTSIIRKNYRWNKVFNDLLKMNI